MELKFSSTRDSEIARIVWHLAGLRCAVQDVSFSLARTGLILLGVPTAGWTVVNRFTEIAHDVGRFAVGLLGLQPVTPAQVRRKISEWTVDFNTEVGRLGELLGTDKVYVYTPVASVIRHFRLVLDALGDAEVRLRGTETRTLELEAGRF
jgi:hypothetical protein